MEFLDSLILWVTGLVGEHLYTGVFAAALIETIIPPIPTLAIFPTAGFLARQAGLDVIEVAPMILLGGLGATIGSTGIYVIALKLGRVVLVKYLKYFRITESKLDRVERWFARYGDKSVLLGRMVPVVREMISVPAGLLQMSPVKFVAYTFAGSCAWAAVTILAGYYSLESLCGLEWESLETLCSV